MMFFAVQGYAQRSGGRNGGERQSVTRSHTPSSRSSVRREAAPRREQARPQSNVTRSSGNQSAQRRENNVRQEPARRVNSQRREPAKRENVRHNQHPPRRDYHSPHPKPSFDHNRLHHHHTHHCDFSRWEWYIWGSYNNRFIRHMHYHNRFFDSLLGYYIWGSIDNPEKIEIGNMSFTRHYDELEIRIGNKCTYLDLYRCATISYTVDYYTTIKVVTSNGRATIYFEDDYGNTAIYRL